MKSRNRKFLSYWLLRRTFAGNVYRHLLKCPQQLTAETPRSLCYIAPLLYDCRRPYIDYSFMSKNRLTLSSDKVVLIYYSTPNAAIKFTGSWGEETGQRAGFFVSEGQETLRTAFFIDGYNLFYGLLAGTPYKWLNLPALLSHITQVQNPASQTMVVNYFTSPVIPRLATRGRQSGEAQDIYLRALKTQDVNIHLGRHRLERGSAPRYTEGTPASRTDKVDIWDLEEKETDVSIAISMYRLISRQQHLAPEERIEQLVLVSADTDMTPALIALREDFPDITVGIILPHRQGIDRGVPGSLKNHSDWIRRHVTIEELKNHQFPDRVPTRKKPADKPEYW